MTEADSKTTENREDGGEANLLEIGTVIDGKYLITGYLGRGGMGAVYRARHGNLGTEVALKTMHPHCVTDANSIERFRREAHIISELRHKNILNIYAFGEWNGLQYIAMEFISGNSLRDYIVARVSLSPAEAMPYLLQICDAMAYAHKHDVLHRDLKPDNVLVEVDSADNRIVKVVDFGLAQLLSDEEMQRLTRTGMVVGDPHYMSPEQAQGLQLDTRSDIYAFGCLMYELLSGNKPFDAETAVATLFKQVSEESVPFADKLGVPGALESIAFKAMEKKPEDRYASFEELAAQLRAAEANPSIKIERKHRPSRLFLFVKRYGVIALMPVLLVIVMFAVMFGGTRGGTGGGGIVDEEEESIARSESTVHVRQLMNKARSAIRRRDYGLARLLIDEAESMKTRTRFDPLTEGRIDNLAGIIEVESNDESKDTKWAGRALVFLERALTEFEQARAAAMTGSHVTTGLRNMQLARIDAGELESYANILVAAGAVGKVPLQQEAARRILKSCEFDSTLLAREHQTSLVLSSFDCLFNQHLQNNRYEAKKLVDRKLDYMKRLEMPEKQVAHESEWMLNKLGKQSP